MLWADWQPALPHTNSPSRPGADGSAGSVCPAAHLHGLLQHPLRSATRHSPACRQELAVILQSITWHQPQLSLRMGQPALSLYLFVNNAALLKQVLPWAFTPQRILLTVPGPICLWCNYFQDLERNTIFCSALFQAQFQELHKAPLFTSEPEEKRGEDSLKALMADINFPELIWRKTTANHEAAHTLRLKFMVFLIRAHLLFHSSLF